MRFSCKNKRTSLRRARPRDGITLLFVVSMIVLFLLMGTTFVIVANNFQSSSRKRAEKSRFVVDHQPVIENAFYQLLRGTELDNANSPLRSHSLLEDMYGYGFSATVGSSVADTSGHFFTITLNADTRSVIDQSPTTVSPIPGTLSGLVLSIVDGPAKGLTTRVIDHQVLDVSGTNVHRLVLKPHWMDNQFSTIDAAAVVGSRVVVNGRPFAGTGAGTFGRASLDAPALSAEALVPNRVGQTRTQLFGTSAIPGYFSVEINSGGSTTYTPNSRGPNEPYDTFDFQNMFLAGISAGGAVIEPSFHRQTLVDHSPVPARADFRAFDRGGPNDDGVVVDNNGDGTVEGIWMDIGSPIQTGPDGQTYKSLVSYTVVDMDSRLNLNAHGNRSHDVLGIPGDTRIGTLGGTSLIRGLGMGPAEIRLEDALGGGSTISLLAGNGTWPGRYGFDGKPGLPDTRDVWSSYKLFGYPDNPYSGPQPGSVGGHFGSTMDLFGRIGFVYPGILDISDNTTPIGLPTGDLATSGLPSESLDSPYEINFSKDAFFGPVAQADALFTPRELEAVFRRFDPDSRLLPQRLLDIQPMLAGPQSHLVTTESYEVPTLPENLQSRLYQLLLTSNSGSGENGIPNSTANRGQVIRDTIQLLLPNEFLRGLPMDVNRPFGDGIDNNGNGLIDEMGEVDVLAHPGGSTNRFDHDNDSSTTSDANSVLARANFARQLFVLTLLVAERVDRNGDGQIDTNNLDWYDFNDDGTTNFEDRIAFRRAIAQWAINVADFRDPDSVMTPFEVDLNPFNGWDVDGDLTTEESITESAIEMRQVFWGAERPELLISETLACHDTRLQDLGFETPVNGGNAGVIGTGDDSDFDSHLVPRPSVFFELYNPWVINDANQVRPAELYDTGRNGVDLQKRSLDGTTPIWRLVVTEVDDPNTAIDERDLDPDDPINNPGGQVQQHIRRIYFTRPDHDFGPEVFYPEDSIVARSVAPGQYSIVGSAGIKVGDRYQTYFGRRTVDALDPDKLANETRRLSLNPTTDELEVVSRSTIGTTWQVSTRTISVLPIGINDGGWERYLGVSDPLEGYLQLNDPVTGVPLDLVEIPDGHKFSDSVTTGTPVDYAFDEPVDRVADQNHFDRFLKDSGIKPGYRVVHLQRLAHPRRRFDALTNPYRTIDSAALDLFVFNGADIRNDPNNSPGEMRFGTSERRAEQNTATATGEEISVDRHRTLFRNDKLGFASATALPINNFGGSDEHVLSRNLVESLGRLNKAFQEAGSADQRPFGALQWNNRPFASQLELAHVPFTSSYDLTRRFSVADKNREVYSPDVPPVAGTGTTNIAGHFSHLLNFYVDELSSTDQGPGLHRLFGFVEVPSRYLGTESFVNPVTFADDAHGLSFGLAAPFDRISSYRYPGKVNINTITSSQVWNAVMGDYATTVSYAEWEASRRGNQAITNFGNPYRPANAANVVPLAGLVQTPADAGLFRRKVDASGTPVDEPLFDYASPASPPPAATDENRAAMFRYGMRQRMGNLVTGRSSVFAVWITVGNFATSPDGTLLTDVNGQGIEIGVEGGTAKRGRGFFLVDRSIPVAFEPGMNHNVDRAVLVKSIIE